MPKRHRNRHKKTKGGFLGFGSASDTASGDTTNGSWFTNVWSKTKQGLSGAYNSASTQLSTSPYTPTQSYGGKTKRHKHRRSMKGGFTGYTPTTGLSSNAASFSGSTAQPQVWLGGRKSRKCRHSRKHKHNKTCKNHK